MIWGGEAGGTINGRWKSAVFASTALFMDLAKGSTTMEIGVPVALGMALTKSTRTPWKTSLFYFSYIIRYDWSDMMG